jgi:hypothetical protein
MPSAQHFDPGRWLPAGFEKSRDDAVAPFLSAFPADDVQHVELLELGTMV